MVPASAAGNLLGLETVREIHMVTNPFDAKLDDELERARLRCCVEPVDVLNARLDVDEALHLARRLEMPRWVAA